MSKLRIYNKWLPYLKQKLIILINTIKSTATFEVRRLLIAGLVTHLAIVVMPFSVKAVEVTNESNAQNNKLTEQQQAIEKVKHYQKLTEKKPDDGDAWFNLGTALFEVEKYGLALVAFDQVIEIKGENLTILSYKASAAFIINERRIDETIQALIDKVLILDPQNIVIKALVEVAQKKQLTEQQQAIAQVKHYKELTEKEPEDSDAWYGLGQALVGVGEFDFAMTAFDQVIRIKGESADILGVKAQAAYYKNDGEIDETVQALIDKALALDPLDPSTNILLGMNNFTANNYSEAIVYWQKLLDSGRENVNVSALSDAISKAKEHLALIDGSAKTNGIDINGGVQAIKPQLTVKVSLSEEILGLISQGVDKVIFVYAVPSDGGRMPLAAIKIYASDLPTTITLDDSSAMVPEINLSSVTQVNLYAVLSKDGGSGIKSGDFKAQVNNISVNGLEPIHLIISSKVP